MRGVSWWPLPRELFLSCAVTGFRCLIDYSISSSDWDRVHSKRLEVLSCEFSILIGGWSWVDPPSIFSNVFRFSFGPEVLTNRSPCKSILSFYLFFSVRHKAAADWLFRLSTYPLRWLCFCSNLPENWYWSTSKEPSSSWTISYALIGDWKVISTLCSLATVACGCGNDAEFY